MTANLLPLVALALLLALTPPSTQDCVNEHGRTKCWNLAPLKEDDPITYDEYLPKFELENYTGPLTKSTFRNLPRIEQLSLTNCHLTSVDGEAFCGLPKLKFIYISDSRLPNVTADTFGTCCHLLHTLGIQKSDIRDVAGGSFRYLNQLDTLLVQHSTLSVLRADTFKGLNQLQHLSLKGNSISVIEDGAFNDLTNLKILNLNNNKLKEVSMEELRKLTALEDLYLSGNEITEFEVKELLEHLNRLVFLSFYFNKVSCDQLKVITADLKARKVGKQVFQVECLTEPPF